MMRRALTSTAPVLLITALSMLTTAPAMAADDDGPKLEDVTKLTVRGEAELHKPADQVRLSIGVVTEGAEAGATLRENNRTMEAVVKALDRVGLAEGEYETGRFRIRPDYERRPTRPEPDWKPRIIGYEVVNSVNVKTTQLELAGAIIEAASKAGANTAEVAGFELEDPRTYRAEAIREATRHAIDDARTLADAASVKLVRIVAMNLDHTPVRHAATTFAARGRAMSEAGGAPPVTPGDVTIEATVTIVYEIAPAATP